MTTTIQETMTDSATMVRRNVLHLRRYPSMTLMLVMAPILFLLLFVYVLGDTLGTGLGTSGTGRAAYLDYVTPGIALIAVTSAAQGTAISCAMDMTEGIVARFRTMAIARSALLTGHVIGSMIQAMICLGAVLGVAVLIGFRPDAGALGWLGAVGILALLAFALTWLSVALGLVSPNVETASNWPMLLMLLPFTSSAFVPTDSLPGGLRTFAEAQPFTPVIETVRSFLAGDGAGGDALAAVAWCLAIAAVGFVWSMRLFRREPRST